MASDDVAVRGFFISGVRLAIRRHLQARQAATDPELRAWHTGVLNGLITAWNFAIAGDQAPRVRTYDVNVTALVPMLGQEEMEDFLWPRKETN